MWDENFNPILLEINELAALPIFCDMCKFFTPQIV
jgi:hypothetical protein